MPVASITNASSQGRLVSHAGHAMFSQIVRRTVRFVFLFLAARKLGPETFGVYVLLLAILETLSLMTGEGLTDYVAREACKLPSTARSLFNRVSAIRWFLAALLAPLAILVLRLFHYPPDVQWCAALLFVILIARGPLAAAQGLFRAANRMQWLVWLEVVQAFVLLCSGSYSLLHSGTLQGVVLAELAAACAGAIAAAILARRSWQSTVKQTLTWQTIWKAAATFNVFPLITNIYDRIDIVILSVIAGNAAAGLYALPYRVLATLQIVPFGLMAVVLPLLAARAPASGDKQFCLRMATLLGVLSMFPALILTLLAKPLVHVILGESYAESTNILRLLVWAAIPMFINYGLNTFLLARDRERVFLRTSAVCAIANITLNLAFIPRYSFYAAAAITIVTELILLAQNIIIIRKKFDFVALPQRLWFTAGILLSLVAVAQVASRHISPLLVVVPACLTFCLALYLDGSLREIRESMGLGLRSA